MVKFQLNKGISKKTEKEWYSVDVFFEGDKESSIRPHRRRFFVYKSEYEYLRTAFKNHGIVFSMPNTED